MHLDDMASDLTGYMDQRMARRHVPGVAVGIVFGEDDLIVTRGVTSVDHPLDVDAATLFQVGSRTKTFTVTALLPQVEAGRLDLDAPLVNYLPEFALATPEYTSRVTTRHLLTHTGGWIGDHFLAMPLRDRGSGALATLVEAMVEVPCLLPPGEKFSYNNAGFCVAGRLLEVLAGRPYETAVRELVLEPLGLEHSFYFPEDVITERTAVGHIVRAGVPEVARPWGISPSSHPTGGIASDVRDQLRYARFHLGDGTTPDGKRLLSAAMLAEMQTPQVPAICVGDAMGLPWMIRDIAGVRAVNHGGGMNGQMSDFLLIPSRGFAISVCTNASTGGLLAQDVVNWVVERVCGLRDDLLTPLPMSAGQLDEYAGSYSVGFIQVEREDDHLLVRQQAIAGSELMQEAPPPVRIGFYDEDCIFDLDEPHNMATRGKFLRGDDGRIEYLHFHARLLLRLAEA